MQSLPVLLTLNKLLNYRAESNLNHTRMMTSNTTLGSGSTSSTCGIYVFLGGNPDQTNNESYGVLVVLMVPSIITSPVTTFLNALVIIAVKTKSRLQAMPNTIIGCLAVTDGLMGMIGLPIFTAARISTLQTETSSDFCTVKYLSRNVIRVIGAATVLHLVLMNVERYIALKHTLITSPQHCHKRSLTRLFLSLVDHGISSNRHTISHHGR